MRPERAIVKKSIQDAEGNLTRAATLLGCSRQTLYVWIYQLGLDRLAGIRLDTRPALDRGRRVDTRHGNLNEPGKSGVQSTGPLRPMLSIVTTQSVDAPVQATVKVRESLWKEVKIEAIRRDSTVGALVEEALEFILRGKKVKAAE
jgi:transposase-like protein